MLRENKENDVLKLISDIKQSKLLSSYDIAMRTEKILENLVTQGTWNTAEELMNLIKANIKEITNYLPTEIISINILRHMLKVIREEHDLQFKQNKSEAQQSLHHLITADSTNDSGDYSKPLKTLRSSLLDHLGEYKTELESSVDNIANQASEHIHSNETILTIGRSKTVEKFLKKAAKCRKFQVIVVEAGAMCDGHAMSMSLGKSNIQTTVIPDSSVFATMSRVNKVIIGTHTVMADGSLRAKCGTRIVSATAKHFSVPVLVLTHLYKLSPLHVCAYDESTFNSAASPQEILPLSMGPVHSKVTVYNPIFDRVPPEQVNLYITHQGGNAPSYIYRLLSELYHPDDYDL